MGIFSVFTIHLQTVWYSYQIWCDDPSRDGNFYGSNACSSVYHEMSVWCYCAISNDISCRLCCCRTISRGRTAWTRCSSAARTAWTITSSAFCAAFVISTKTPRTTSSHTTTTCSLLSTVNRASYLLTTSFTDYCAPAPRVGALSDDARLTSVCRIHRP